MTNLGQQLRQKINFHWCYNIEARKYAYDMLGFFEILASLYL